jgi:chitin synthase
LRQHHLQYTPFQTNIRLRPPKKIPTPYGGRLLYVLPGKTKMFVHLKDKAKIRHKKRWSQCMYMYYLVSNVIKLFFLVTDEEAK